MIPPVSIGYYHPFTTTGNPRSNTCGIFGVAPQAAIASRVRDDFPDTDGTLTLPCRQMVSIKSGSRPKRIVLTQPD